MRASLSLIVVAAGAAGALFVGLAMYYSAYLVGAVPVTLAAIVLLIVALLYSTARLGSGAGAARIAAAVLALAPLFCLALIGYSIVNKTNVGT